MKRILVSLPDGCWKIIEKKLKALKKYCGKVLVLEPMATTSTSAKIRRLQIGTAKKLGQALTPKILKTIQDVLDEIKR